MKKSTWLQILLVLAILAGGVYGFTHLFQLRFAAGDVYPAYSSLRADPKGCKALHDALREVPGLHVSRNFDDHPKLRYPAQTTLILGGLGLQEWPLRDVEELETFVKAGGRLVLTFLPATRLEPSRAEEKLKEYQRNRREADKNDPTKKRKVEQEENEEKEMVPFKTLASRWGFEPGFLYGKTQKAEKDDDPATLMAKAMDDHLVEPSLSWHSALHFTPKDESAETWRVLYRCEGAPVIMERTLGSGTLVLSADSYFLSNEAAREERVPKLLSWMIGDGSEVIFDETHLGVHESAGIAALARKYGLEGAVLALLVLSGLFVWQTASPFLPPPAERLSGEEGVVQGKDATSGFISLLRLGVAPNRLIEVCLEQWRKSPAFRAEKKPEVLARIEAAAAEGRRAPVAAYQKICHILAEKK